MNETQLKPLKTFSDSDICRNEESNHATSQEKEMVKLTGTLTSRIEKKGPNPYHYGFFKFPNQEPEIPVIFKDEKGNYKPNIPKGSQVLLQGNWAKSNNSRPSFTCQEYQILKDPPELTIQSLREQIQPLLTPALKEKQTWTQTTDFLFKKWGELKKIEQLSQLGSQYLNAYLLLKNVDYSASSEGKLELEDFNQAKCLSRIASELEPIEKQIKALQRPEVAGSFSPKGSAKEVAN